MRIRQISTAVAMGLGILLGSTAANAGVITIVLPDIATFAEYDVPNVGQTFTGDGFVGLYDFGPPYNDEFGHLFGLEGAFSRTVLQAYIASLSGVTINSASLSFQLLDAHNLGTQTTVTGYAGNGALGYQFTAPAALYSSSMSGPLAAGFNTIDVTNIVASAVFANEDWLNLHLVNSGDNDWTYTYTGFGYGPDSAEVRLTINFTEAPEPSTTAVICIGLIFLLGFGIRRARAAA